MRPALFHHLERRGIQVRKVTHYFFKIFVKGLGFTMVFAVESNTKTYMHSGKMVLNILPFIYKKKSVTTVTLLSNQL